MDPKPQVEPKPTWLSSGTDCAALIAAQDWARTPLGAIADWPAALRSATLTMLASVEPMHLVWGQQRIFLCNDAYAPILGARLGEAIGARFEKLFARSWDALEPCIAKGFAGRGSKFTDVAIMHPERGETWWSFSYTPVFDADGAVAGLLCLTRETTSHVLRETALIAAEARYRQILDSATDYAIITTDLAGTIVQWNEGARRILGWSEAEMLGQRADRFFTPEDVAQDRMSAEMRSALETGRGTDERWHVRKSGERFWADGEMTVLRDGAGAAAGFVKVMRDRTEEHRAREALADSEASLRRAQEAGQVGVFSAGRDDRVFGTAEFCRIFGLPDCDGRPATDLEALVLPEDRALVSDAARRSDGTAAVDVEYRIRRPDTGEIRWISRRAEFERDADGAIVRLLGVVQDITDREAAHRALSDSEAKFRAFTEAVPNQVWTATPDGALDWTNRRVREFGGGERILRGDGDLPMARDAWLTRVHPDDRAAAADAWRHALEHGEPYEIEFRLRRHDGAFRWHLSRALPLKDGDGQVSRWIGTNTEIDDQRRAREALADLNAALERRVEEQARERDRLWLLSEDMLARADYEGGMSAVNPAWTKLLGWSEHELLTNAYADIIHPDDVAATIAALDQMRATCRSARFENRILAKDGAWTPVAWTVSPEPNSDQFIAVGRDMSDFRARERELALAQDALRQSQKLESMGQLTGGVAHDFNNLLTPIIGSLDMLMRRGIGSERERRLIDGALQSAERAKMLVQRLLAFARRQPLQPTAVDLHALIGGMADLIGSTLGPKIEIRLALEPGLPPAKADPNQLEMAILNLSVNARDAMPDGGELTIAARRSRAGADHPGLRPGHYVCLTISDTGTGMDDDTRARAIEPFFSTKGVGKGTGLGLSMAHGLAAQLGGGLTIRSAPGDGTTIELWLPISLDRPIGDDTRPAAAPASSARGTVLLVDDEPLVRMSTADMLGDLGYDVVEAASGEEALALVDQGVTPDLLVSDHLMPGMNGEQLARALRAAMPAMPVLIVSGYAEAEGIAGDLSRLTKPFRNAELAERLAIIHPAGAGQAG